MGRGVAKGNLVIPFGRSYYSIMTLLAIGCLLLNGNLQSKEILVGSLQDLRQALLTVRPGSVIWLAPGKYEGGLFVANVHGEEGRPIVIRSSSNRNRAVFGNTGTGIQLSNVSHLRLMEIRVENCSNNGINIDDGGNPNRPSKDIVLQDIAVSDIAKGNHDGVKLSGVDNFRLTRVSVRRWGGSAIDMVGCHDGLIEQGTFESGGDNGIQAKGGSSNISIRDCGFLEPGQRGVNLGGSTGFDYFRPPLTKMPANARFEAKDISVQGCFFRGGTAAAAFVGVDGAKFAYNTILNPGKWAFRILQETRDPSFVPSRRGTVARNLILFSSRNWSEGGVNIGPGTDAQSFRFEQNFWFCEDKPDESRPKLPTGETEGTYGVDPQVEQGPSGLVRVARNSPAGGVGAHAFRRAERPK